MCERAAAEVALVLAEPSTHVLGLVARQPADACREQVQDAHESGGEREAKEDGGGD